MLKGAHSNLLKNIQTAFNIQVLFLSAPTVQLINTIFWSIYVIV